MPSGVSLALDCLTSGAAFPLWVMLVDSTHDFTAAIGSLTLDQVTGDEIAATGYARVALAYATGVTIDSDNSAIITWQDTSFGVVGGALDATVGGAYAFANTGLDSSSPLLWSLPFTDPVTTDGTDLVIRWGSPTAAIRP